MRWQACPPLRCRCRRRRRLAGLCFACATVMVRGGQLPRRTIVTGLGCCSGGGSGSSRVSVPMGKAPPHPWTWRRGLEERGTPPLPPPGQRPYRPVWLIVAPQRGTEGTTPTSSTPPATRRPNPTPAPPGVGRGGRAAASPRAVGEPLAPPKRAASRGAGTHRAVGQPLAPPRPRNGCHGYPCATLSRGAEVARQASASG